MSLHSVYNIVALAAFALGAAALITAAILFVSQRLWEVMSVRHKRPASARRTTGHTAQVRTPPQPTGGRNTSVLNQSTNTANGTRPANDPESFVPGTSVLDRSVNAANGTTLLNSQADVAAGTTLLKAEPTAPPSASGGTTLLNSQADVSAGTTLLKAKPTAPPSASGGTTMLRVTPGAPAARVRRAEDVVSAHVLGAYAASIRPNRSEQPAVFRIVKDEVVVHTSEVI